MKKLQPKTIRRRKRKALLAYNKVRKEANKKIDDAAAIRRSLVFNLIKRCSHNNTRWCSGQYMRCVEICDICGGERFCVNEEFQLNW